MKTLKKMMICVLLMGAMTASTGCDELLYDLAYDYGFGYGYGYGYDYGYDGYYSGGSSSGTFHSDYGGSVSWW